MDAKISREFWSDPAIEALSADQRMAALWCITSSRTTLFGFVEVTKKRFEFETGTPYEALQSLTEAHAKGFVKCGAGIWIRRFIARQFGTGIKLVKNNFSKGLVDELRAYEGLPVFAQVLSEYPELRGVYDNRFHSDTAPLTAPDSEPLAEGLPSPREEKRREEGEESLKLVADDETSPESVALSRLKSLFRIRPSTTLDEKQVATWKKNKGAVLAASEDAWLLMEWWYRQPDGERQIAQYRKTTFTILLNNWGDELLKAEKAARSVGVHFQTSGKKEAAAEPEGWREAARALGYDFDDAVTWSLVTSDMRRDIRAWLEKNKGGDHA